MTRHRNQNFLLGSAGCSGGWYRTSREGPEPTRLASLFPRGGERARLSTLSRSETGTGADLSTSWAGEEGGGWVLFTPSHTPQRKMERSPGVCAPRVSVLPVHLSLQHSLPRSGSLPWGNTVFLILKLFPKSNLLPLSFFLPFFVILPQFSQPSSSRPSFFPE